MNEKMPPGLTPEQQKKKDEDAQYAQWMEAHPEPEAPALRESGPEIAEFEAMITRFEVEHSLEALHQIIDLAPEEAPKHPLREPARAALEPIVATLTRLKGETNISPEKYADLRAAYKRLSRAVGMINNGKVDHDR